VLAFDYGAIPPETWRKRENATPFRDDAFILEALTSATNICHATNTGQVFYYCG
jgi:hypothetical protein